MSDFEENTIIRWFKSLGKASSNVSNSSNLVPMENVLIDRQPNFVQEERARLLIQANDFDAAISLLEDLPPTQGQQLMLSECYFEVGRDAEAIGCADHLQSLLTSYPRPRASDLTKLVNDYITMSFNVRALIMLRCLSELHRMEAKFGRADESASAIETCSFKCFRLVDTMVEEGDRMRSVAAEYGPKFMFQMLSNLREIKGGDLDKRTEHEARCFNNLGLSYRAVKNYHRSIKFFRAGVRLLKRRKGGTASSNRVLGDLLRNMGLVLHDHGNYPAAGSLYIQSLNAYGKAEKMQAEGRKLSDRTKTI